MPRKGAGADDDSSGEFFNVLQTIGGKNDAQLAKKTEKEMKGVSDNQPKRRHRHSAGKRVVLHQDEKNFRPSSRERQIRKRREEQLRYYAVQTEEQLRRDKQRQRRDARRAARRGQPVDNIERSAELKEPKVLKEKKSKKSKTSSSSSSSSSDNKKDGKLFRSYGVKDDLNSAHKKVQEDGSLIEPSFNKNKALFVVFDGHAGRGTVEHAEKALTPALEKAADENKGDWEKAFTAAFAQLDEETKSLKDTSGATVVAAVVDKNTVHVANAGDARAVLYSDGVITRVSFDHKASDPGEVKRCEELGASFLWGRLQGQTMITRALGDHDMKQYCVSTPYYSKTDFKKGKSFLILACDGIWDVMEDDAAVDAVKDLALTGKAEEAAAKLISESLRLESKDNLTAMVVSL